MSGFDTAWLDLREPADAAARDAGLLAAAASHLDAVGGDVLDLGCGTGATFRALAPVLERRLRWRLLDNDPALLDEARRRGSGETELVAIQADLGDVEALLLDGVGLVTASALLDLVSERWIERLAQRLVHAGVGFYAALNYDGSMAWEEPHPLDATVLRAFNAHQATDKGLGPALGPAAARTAGDSFRRLGCAVAVASSPWRLGPAELELQRRLIAGITDAVVEMGVAPIAADGWRAARMAAASRSGCTVGHDDLLVLPVSRP
jgi:SAM-dependent methyltransferase